MRFLSRDDRGFEGLARRNRLKAALVGAAWCAGLLALSMLAATPCSANSIPAWLDDAITTWNKANPKSPIQFVGIKDSYVWYSIPDPPEGGSKTIRDRVYGIANKNGYANTQDEEIVTTGTPMSPNGALKTRKCWTRSFLRTLQETDSGKGQRMLTTMVCEGEATWAAGFRVIQ